MRGTPRATKGVCLNMKEARLTGLAHIGIKTDDVQKSIAFYKELGFTLDNYEDIGAKLGFMSLGNCLIELIEPADKETLKGLKEGIVAHVAIECENIEGVAEKLKAKGYVDQEASINTMGILGGVKNLFFKGPSGEELELFDYYTR